MEKTFGHKQINNKSSVKNRYTIREIDSCELPILKEFLYNAIFIPEGADLPPKSILEKDDLRVYIEKFGSLPDDKCYVAVIGSKIIGAVWVRIMEDYGHIDNETPSFAISVIKDYRKRGIGTELMTTMLQYLKINNYKKASLAVQKANYAVKMYRKIGFQICKETDEEYIMVCNLQK